MTARSFIIQAGGKRMALQTYIVPDGKFAQYMVALVPAATLRCDSPRELGRN